MSLWSNLFAPPQMIFSDEGVPVPSAGRAKRIYRWLARRYRKCHKAIASGSDAQREGDWLAAQIIPLAHHDHPIHATIATVLAHEIRRGIANNKNPFDDPGAMLKLQLSGGKDM